MSIAVRVFGLLLIVTPILLFLEFFSRYPTYSISYFVYCYFRTPILFLPSLAAIIPGLWLLLAPLSLKNGITALLAAVPYFFLLSFVYLTPRIVFSLHLEHFKVYKYLGTPFIVFIFVSLCVAVFLVARICHAAATAPTVNGGIGVAVRVISLLLIIAPFVMSVIAIQCSLPHPPKYLNEWMGDTQRRWDVLSLLDDRLSSPISILSSLVTIGSGLWLLLVPLSGWKGAVALVPATLWLLLFAWFF